MVAHSREDAFHTARQAGDSPGYGALTAAIFMSVLLSVSVMRLLSGPQPRHEPVGGKSADRGFSGTVWMIRGNEFYRLRLKNGTEAARKKISRKRVADLLGFTEKENLSKDRVTGRSDLIEVRLAAKSVQARNWAEWLSVDMVLNAVGLQKKIVAVKGKLVFSDALASSVLTVDVGLGKSIEPGGTLTLKGWRIPYNPLLPEQAWFACADTDDVNVEFYVEKLKFEDGSVKEYR